jgi:pimeloyl-ACP methyl ester carboxylesterase
MDLPAGIRLHYLEAGQGAPIVFVHGGMGDCFSWQPQLDAFAPQFRVISYSRRYSYPNANPADERNHSSRNEARDLDAFLRRLRCRPAHIVGTSYGALIALTYALNRPREVLSLVLAEPPLLPWVRAAPNGGRVCDTFLREVWEPAARAFVTGRPQHAMRRLYDGMRGPGRFDLLSDGQLEAILRNTRAMERLVLSTDPFPDPSMEAVARLQMPVLLISGENTVPFHRLAHAAVSQVLPRALQMVIANAGHAAANENPEAFNDALGGLVGGRRR